MSTLSLEAREGELRKAFDGNRRALVKLVAESLHDHPRGAELLLWRSKRFTVGGTDVDP